MCLRFIASLDEYEWFHTKQHPQNEGSLVMRIAAIQQDRNQAREALREVENKIMSNWQDVMTAEVKGCDPQSYWRGYNEALTNAVKSITAAGLGVDK